MKCLPIASLSPSLFSPPPPLPPPFFLPSFLPSPLSPPFSPPPLPPPHTLCLSPFFVSSSKMSPQFGNDRSVRFVPFSPPPNSMVIHKLCIFFFVLQLSLSLSQFFHNSSLILRLHSSAFHYQISRFAVFVSLFINLCWSLSVISAIFGLALNNSALILSHLSFSLLLLPFQMVTLFLLILSSSFALSIANAFACVALLAVSIPIEWNLLRRIRRKAMAEGI